MPNKRKPKPPQRETRLSAAKGYTRPDFSEGFNITAKIVRLEDKLDQNCRLTRRQRIKIEEEIRALKDKLTRGKTRFAADQHRKLIEAALNVWRRTQPATSSMAVADIIRELHQDGATWYENAQGIKITYTDRHIRKILDNELKLTAALRSLK